jgi:hypothetical protein
MDRPSSSRESEGHTCREQRENLGIFPVSVVTLHAAGWEMVDRTRTNHPTFLAEKSPAGPEPVAPTPSDSSQ